MAEIHIAFDFGTSTSGWAWTQKDGSKTYARTDWAGEGRPVYPKAPTALLYREGEFDSWGWDAVRKFREFGNQPGFIYLTGFKLFLNGEDSVGPLPHGWKFVKDEGSGEPMIVVKGKEFNVVDLVAKVLSKLNDDVKRDVEDSVGSGHTFYYSITVPAIWSARTKALMRKAAERAKIVDGRNASRLSFPVEPQAAALHCLPLPSTTTRDIVVLDCGGGTTDLAAFSITSDGNYNEIVVPEGVRQGAGDLDRACQGWVDQWVRENHQIIGYTDGLRINDPVAYEKMMDRWESVKCMTDGSIEEEPLILDIANSRRPCHLPVKQIFDPVIDKIVQAIDRFISSVQEATSKPQIDTLVMVGGFSASPILQKAIKANYEGPGKWAKKVHIPQNSGQAVVAGGAHYSRRRVGSAKSLITLANKTYGIKAYRPFKDGDPERRRSKTEGCPDQLMDVFWVFVRKGDPVTVNDKFEDDFTPSSPNQEHIEIELLCTDHREPSFSDDPGVEKLATINVPFPGTGMDRRIFVILYFGETELYIAAKTEDQKTFYRRRPIRPDGSDSPFKK